jgi:hypothetical protein
MYKHNTTSTDLDQMNYHRLEVPLGSPTQYDLIQESAALTGTANYIYISNNSTEDAQYITISIKEEVIGSLYGGDFMLLPWSAAVHDDGSDDFDQSGLDSTIEIQAFGAEQVVEYAFFHSGETLLTADDLD